MYGQQKQNTGMGPEFVIARIFGSGKTPESAATCNQRLLYYRTHSLPHLGEQRIYSLLRTCRLELI